MGAGDVFLRIQSLLCLKKAGDFAGFVSSKRLFLEKSSVVFSNWSDHLIEFSLALLTKLLISPEDAQS